VAQTLSPSVAFNHSPVFWSMVSFTPAGTALMAGAAPGPRGQHTLPCTLPHTQPCRLGWHHESMNQKVMLQKNFGTLQLEHAGPNKKLSFFLLASKQTSRVPVAGSRTKNKTEPPKLSRCPTKPKTTKRPDRFSVLIELCASGEVLVPALGRTIRSYVFRSTS
jgi:hypothetical protein